MTGNVVVAKQSFQHPVVAKLRGDSGQVVWTYELRDASTPQLAAMADGDVVVAAGLNPQGLLLARLTADGKERWTYRLTGGSHSVDAVAPLDAGGFVVAASFVGAPAVGNRQRRNREAFVAAFHPDGAFRWQMPVRDSRSIHAVTALAAAGDDVVIGGSFRGRLSIGDRTAEADELAGYVARLRAEDGSARWLRTPTPVDGFVQIAVHGDRLLVTGTAPAGRVLAGLDAATGDLLWSQPYGNGSVHFHPLAISGNSLVVAGAFSSRLELGPTRLRAQGFDSMLARLDPAPPCDQTPRE